MTDLAHDALYETVTRLARLAREGKLYTTESAAPEVTQLLLDAQTALELAGMPPRPVPLPHILPGPTIEAQPVERRKDW